jgi:hypothetical protein
VARGGRLVVLVCVLGLGVLALGAAPASPGSPQVHFDATLTARTTGGSGWCCGRLIEFEGSGVLMGVGAVEFTGRWLSGCSFPFAPTPCFRRLDLMLVASNGDRLSIRGNDEWTFPSDPEPTALMWSTDSVLSSGRLARFVASGTYTVKDEGPGVTISLDGTSQHGGPRSAS